jgi:hypothetical protein
MVLIAMLGVLNVILLLFISHIVLALIGDRTR